MARLFYRHPLQDGPAPNKKPVLRTYTTTFWRARLSKRRPLSSLLVLSPHPNKTWPQKFLGGLKHFGFLQWNLNERNCTNCNGRFLRVWSGKKKLDYELIILLRVSLFADGVIRLMGNEDCAYIDDITSGADKYLGYTQNMKGSTIYFFIS